ncbi:hypothetical protein [Streptomyces sp. NPDC001307]|uniref:hypothetical protein n=1 Tax=Streptomyces sp. NPDC001307 TaxID=3364560 RepID=UPI00369FB22E
MTANRCVCATAEPPAPGATPSTSASTDEYQAAILPTSGIAGTPEDTLDCTCGPYLTDPGI